jgi:hypothetical protein
VHEQRDKAMSIRFRIHCHIRSVFNPAPELHCKHATLELAKPPGYASCCEAKISANILQARARRLQCKLRTRDFHEKATEPTKMAFLKLRNIITIIIVCTIIVIIEEYIITSQTIVISSDWRNFMNFLGQVGFFGGVFGLLTKYRQQQLYSITLARFRNKPSKHTLVDIE